MYIPSDFFSTNFRWVDAFPPHMPFTLNKPCSFHVMHKDVDPCNENTAALEPSDADYLFSAKVCQKLCCDRRLHDEREAKNIKFERVTHFVAQRNYTAYARIYACTRTEMISKYVSFAF